MWRVDTKKDQFTNPLTATLQMGCQLLELFRKKEPLRCQNHYLLIHFDYFNVSQPEISSVNEQTKFYFVMTLLLNSTIDCIIDYI